MCENRGSYWFFPRTFFEEVLLFFSGSEGEMQYAQTQYKHYTRNTIQSLKIYQVPLKETILGKNPSTRRSAITIIKKFSLMAA